MKRSGRSGQIPSRQLGSTTLKVLAPTHPQLKELKNKWREWAKDHTSDIVDLEREIDDIMLTGREPRAVKIAKRTSLTPQNLVSIVVLAEDNGHKVLFTGDTHQTDIIKGLKAANQLEVFDPARKSGLHIDVLKVQHHGSPNNLDCKFSTRVTADHYVFCGNGAHGNPSVEVVDHIINSRIEPVGSNKRAVTPQTGQPFHLWFTSHEDRNNSAVLLYTSPSPRDS